MNISQATSFLKRNLTAAKDFGSVEANRGESKRVDSELERIGKDTVDVSKELGELEKDSNLAPPSFKNVSNKDLLIATTTTGAVIGGGIGILGAITAGPATVTFNETPHEVMTPKLSGAGFESNNVPVTNPDGSIRGWDVDITRRELTSERVGSYTTREPVSSHTTSIVLNGAIGLGIGAAAGAGAGLLGIALRKALKQEYNQSEPRKTEGDTKIIITAGATGAVIGAAAGALSSLVQSHTVSYDTQHITLENKVIGTIPHGANMQDGGFYVPNTGGNQPPANAEAVVRLMNGNIERLGSRDGYKGLDGLAPDEVKADVPKRTIFHNLDVDTEHKTTRVGPGLLGSVVGGAAIGAVTGVAGGVLLNVLRKNL